MAKGLILIVDDNPGVCEAIASALEAYGYETKSAGDGRRGLAAIRSERPSIVLLDLEMPVLDGIGVLEELAKRNIRLPIVLMTAFDKGEAIARQYGVPAYLRKPVALPGLLSAIATCHAVATGVHDTEDVA